VSGDLFGASVAIAGEMVLVGSPAKSNAGARSGAVYLFQRSGGYLEVRKLAASDARAQDYFGGSVALVRGTALVGAPGSQVDAPGLPIGGSGAGGAYVFAASNAAWCSPAPRTECLASWQAGLLRVNDKVAGQERMVVRLRGEPMLSQADFGNPLLVGGTAYLICLYGDSGGQVAQLKIDAAGATCGDTSCWRPIGALPPDGKGFQFHGGLQQLRLHAGAGRSELLYEVTGPAVPARLVEDLALSEHPTVQIFTDDGPACFSLTMSRVQSTRKFFKAKQ
jgi:hypothetical protein